MVMKFYVKYMLITLLIVSDSLYAKGEGKPSYDCTNAYYSVEKLICEDKELSALDVQMASIYSRLLKKYPDSFSEIKAKQTDWIKNRNSCKDTENTLTCTKEVYQSRIDQLHAKVQVDSLTLYDTMGLNGINQNSLFSLKQITPHIPKRYTTKMNTYECETDTCNEIAIYNGSNKLAIIGGEENGFISYILSLDDSIEIYSSQKIGDKLPIKDKDTYQEKCSIGEEYYAGFILCNENDAQHTRVIYKGDYDKADIELPPLDIAQEFKVFAVIWEK